MFIAAYFQPVLCDGLVEYGEILKGRVCTFLPSHVHSSMVSTHRHHCSEPVPPLLAQLSTCMEVWEYIFCLFGKIRLSMLPDLCAEVSPFGSFQVFSIFCCPLLFLNLLSHFLFPLYLVPFYSLSIALLSV